MNQCQALESELHSNNDDNDDKPKVTVYTTAIHGLRGFLSIYIMIFHSLIYSKCKINILGSVQMTYFFLISGFILGLNESKQQYAESKCCTELCSGDGNQFNAKHFWRRRIARTLPLFYLTNLMCIPLVHGGHAHVPPGVVEYVAYVLTLFVVNTWIFIPITLNGPSWFVSTMWFFYWLFPNILPKLQRYEMKEKQKWIVNLFLIQWCGGGLITTICFMFTPWPWTAFFVGTFWPVSRLPVFLMGVVGGLLRREGCAMLERQQSWTSQKWSKISDHLTTLFVVSFIIVGVVNNLDSTKDIEIMFGVRLQGALGINMQFGIAWFALQFITSLTFEDGTSRVSKILTSRVALACGRISYAVYLVHEPFIQYLCWMNYGSIVRPECEWNSDATEQCKDEWRDWDDMRKMPMWCVPVLWVVSILVAVPLNRWVEEPLRSRLRPHELLQSEA